MSNYRFCGSSQIGKSHEMDNTVCQDSHYILEGNGFIATAVADGLGTSKNSDIASNLAAKNSVEYCIKNISSIMTDTQILDGIKDAFEYANNSIKEEAGADIDDYDTTLTLAVFREGDLYYGHAGDSGILALCANGEFEEVTIQQLGEGEGKDRPVYPLINESHWVFDKYTKPVHAIFLMTDGMLNMTVPPILEEQRYKLDHSYLYYLYEETRDGDELDNWIADELSQVSPGMVNYDDKTLIVAICNSINMTAQPDEYYEFPSDALYKSLLSQKPAAAAVAPQSFYEKVKGGLSSKELWKKNRKMIALVASVVLVFSLSLPVTVTLLSGGGTIDPITGEWRPLSFGQAMQQTFTPTASRTNMVVTQDEYDELIETLEAEGLTIQDVLDDIEVIEEIIEEIKATPAPATPVPTTPNPTPTPRPGTTPAPATPIPVQVLIDTPDTTTQGTSTPPPATQTPPPATPTPAPATPTPTPTYTVIFMNGTHEVNRQNVAHGGHATTPSEPTREGHTFTGWSGSLANVTSNRTLNAQFSVNTYTVRFLNHDGTVYRTRDNIQHGGNAAAPGTPPTRDGYDFSGWSGSLENVTSNRDIHSTWTEIPPPPCFTSTCSYPCTCGSSCSCNPTPPHKCSDHNCTDCFPGHDKDNCETCTPPG